MNKSTSISRVIAVTAIAFAAQAALAQAFIDERGQGGTSARVAPSATASSRLPGGITGDFTGAEWKEPSPPMPTADVPLATALMILRPRILPSVTVESPDEILDIPVVWRAGESREAALLDIARKAGLRMVFAPNTVRISYAPQAPAGKQMRDGKLVNAEPGATPAAGGGSKRFEVALNDIKLSESFARWARETGVRVLWEADKHVLISAPMIFEASDAFSAIEKALSTPGIANSEYPLEVCEYPNTPPLLRVTRLGEQAKDCTR